MKKITIYAYAAALLQLASCSKKDSDTGATTSTTSISSIPQIDKVAFEAKWGVVGFYNIFYDSTGALTGYSGASKTVHNNGLFWNDSIETFITFNNDNTYTRVKADGSPGGIIFNTFLPNNGFWRINDSGTAVTFQTVPVGNGPDSLRLRVLNYSVNDFQLYDSSEYEHHGHVVARLEFTR